MIAFCIISIIVLISIKLFVESKVRKLENDAEIERSYQEFRKKEIERQILRNKEVVEFRTKMIHLFPSAVFHMSEYREMLESDKPLIGKEWVRIDELVNLN